MREMSRFRPRLSPTSETRLPVVAVLLLSVCAPGMPPEHLDKDTAVGSDK